MLKSKKSNKIYKFKINNNMKTYRINIINKRIKL